MARRQQTPAGSIVAATSWEGMRMVRVAGFEPSVALGSAERAAYLRRFTVLFADESTRRDGGLGSVVRVTNALGEVFALKTLSVSDGAELPVEDTPAPASAEEAARLAFEEEYLCHRALSELRGFPRLFGRGTVDGAPVLVMEWVAGETLDCLRSELAVDGEGRLSPLTAARLGRELFELICRMQLVGEGVAHRDISPRNIMVRTSPASLAEQVGDGRFDLALIDFGSAARLGSEADRTCKASGFVVACRATPAFAAPEMLTEDTPGELERRRSGAVDVYEAASVIYQLATGRAPFDVSVGEDLAWGSLDADQQATRPAHASAAYRAKTETAPRAFTSAHGGDTPVAELLVAEPEIAFAAGEVALSLGVDPASEELRRALELVDGQLEELLLACLAPEQGKRPTAEGMRDALDGFCEHYAQNVARALRGQVLIPCTGSASWLDGMTPFRLRRLLRAGGRAVAAGAWLFSAGITALLLGGTACSVHIGGFTWNGVLDTPLVAAYLLVPGLLALVVRGRRRGSTVAFARGSVVLAALLVLAMACVFAVDAEPDALPTALAAAELFACASAWLIMVLDFACTEGAALVGEVRRKFSALAAPADSQKMSRRLTTIGTTQKAEGPNAAPGAAADRASGDLELADGHGARSADAHVEYRNEKLASAEAAGKGDADAVE